MEINLANEEEYIVSIDLSNSDRAKAILIIEGKPYISNCDHQDCLEMYYDDKGIDSEFNWKENFDDAHEASQEKTFNMQNDHEVYGFNLYEDRNGYYLIAHDKESLDENIEWAKAYAKETNAKLAYFTSGDDAELAT